MTTISSRSLISSSAQAIPKTNHKTPGDKHGQRYGPHFGGQKPIAFSFPSLNGLKSAVWLVSQLLLLTEGRSGLEKFDPRNRQRRGRRGRKGGGTRRFGEFFEVLGDFLKLLKVDLRFNRLWAQTICSNVFCLLASSVKFGGLLLGLFSWHMIFGSLF